MPSDRSRMDLRTDEDVEYILDRLAERTGYPRPRILRLTLWIAGNFLGVENMPPLTRLLNVKPGRKPKAPAPPAAPTGERDG
jgi:hypothetical protein